ncbi:MAG: AAA family ATPase [Archangium sp.]
MKYLRELEIREFRNVEPTKLQFRRGVNVVLGRNAAGKTTFLETLSRVLCGDSETHEERTHLRYRMTDAGAEFEREFFASEIMMFPGGKPHPTGRMSYRDIVHFSDSGQHVLAEVHDGVIVRFNELTDPQPAEFSGVTGVVRKLFETNSAFGEELLRVAFTDCWRLDESLENLSRLRELTLTRRNGDEWRTSIDATPRELRDGVLNSATSDSGRLDPQFVRRCARTMGYLGGHVRFDYELKTSSGVRESTARNFRVWFTGRGDELSQDSLSYGEKRLLSFFAMSDACPEIMIVDELVNGLHHEWIRACLEEIGTRQAFLTSQNPLLLDYLEFDSAEDVRTGFILCERVVSDTGTSLRWRNPTQSEAEEFFAAYETGIQRVSDILITKGFW